MSKEIIIALIGFLGAISGGIAAIIVKNMEINALKLRRQKGKASTQSDAEVKLTHEKFRQWHTVIILWVFASLAVLAYLVWLPDSENSWFVRIHAVSVAIAVFSGIGMLVLATPRRAVTASSGAETWRIAVSIFVFLVFLVAIVHLGWQFNEWRKLWPSAKLMTVGWDLFRSEDYKTAMTASEECSDDFHGAAEKVERLQSKTLPTGKVTEQQMKEIFDNGVLNDVASCYWIKGRAAQKLHRVDEARVAFNQALRYPHGRVYDERGQFFWSPAEDAEDRLKELQ